MIYTDGVHLVASSLDELHSFAQKSGLKRVWFQDKRIPHYDITTKRMLNRALREGAVLVTGRELVSFMKLVAAS